MSGTLDDVRLLQAARAGRRVDPVPQVDDVQVDGEEDVERAADPAHVAQVFTHLEHFLVRLLVDEAGDVVQRPALFGGEIRGARVDEV